MSKFNRAKLIKLESNHFYLICRPFDKIKNFVKKSLDQHRVVLFLSYYTFRRHTAPRVRY